MKQASIRRFLAFLMVMALGISCLVGCSLIPDLQPTEPQTTEPQTTEPQATEPQPSEPATEPGQIIIQAEAPSDKVVDMESRIDVNGNPFDHSVRVLAADGLEYVIRSETKIIFSAYDSYTYTFEVEKAGVYTLSVNASCDRNSPITYTVNDGDSVTNKFVYNNYQSYDTVALGEVELKEGSNTITFTINENKNHNMWTDFYVLDFVSEVQPSEPPATEPPATEPPATEPPATEPPATEPPATEPPATEPAVPVEIRIEAENPSDKVVDMESRTDVNGSPMDHSKRVLAADGLEHPEGNPAIINFAVYDSYTYTFDVAVAGSYKLYVNSACDRKAYYNYSLDGAAYVEALMSEYPGHTVYKEYDLGTLELTAGTHTITFTNNTVNKNYNSYTDYYLLVPVA